MLLLSSFIEHVFCVECSDVLFCSLSHGSVWKPASDLVFQSVVYNLTFGVLLVLFINLIYCELWSKQKYFLEERGVRRKRFCEFCLFALGGMGFTSFSSSVFICTGRYISLVVPVPNRASSWYATVCFNQFTSSRSLKSSRACAPRDSLRASAAIMVQWACSSRFWSSRVSTRSVFQIMERSVMMD